MPVTKQERADKHVTIGSFLLRSQSSISFPVSVISVEVLLKAVISQKITNAVSRQSLRETLLRHIKIAGSLMETYDFAAFRKNSFIRTSMKKVCNNFSGQCSATFLKDGIKLVILSNKGAEQHFLPEFLASLNDFVVFAKKPGNFDYLWTLPRHTGCQPLS